MLGRIFLKLNKGVIIKVLCLLLMSVITATSVILVLVNNRKSAAYLYDQDSVSVKYGVAKLSFDLSSDHMYTYYAQDGNYTPEFTSMLTTLRSLISSYDMAPSHNISSFETSVKAAMALSPDDTTGYYSPVFISELSQAWDSYISGTGYDAEAYNDAMYTIYNTYYHDYKYLFKIKNMALDSIDSDSTIWYYYAKDLVETYYGKDGRYVVQTDATGLRQSTVKIDVKLRGGTTYNNSTDLTENPYYDTRFNEMVSPLTLNFSNTGDVSLYMNYIIDMQPLSNAGNGVLGMVMPYGMDYESLEENPTYSFCYDAVSGTWDYRALIAALLENHTFSLATPISDYSALDYQAIEALLQEWNLYAVQTYAETFENTELLSNKNNIIVDPADGVNSDYLKKIDVSMLFWADYGRVAFNYDPATPESWRTGDEYARYGYNFTLRLLTSLKDDDMTAFTDDDWAQIYNNRKEYNKIAAVSNFDVEGYAYFENDDADDISINYMEGGYITCNYTDPTARNYIGKLRFSVRYRGFSPASVRVRLVEQFTNTNGKIVAVNLIKFKCAENWYDNRSNDLYFYSDKLYSSVDTPILTQDSRPKYLNIPVITGINYPNGGSTMADVDEILGTDTNMKMKVIFYVEAVQPNRTEEYWGVDVNQIINDITTP